MYHIFFYPLFHWLTSSLFPTSGYHEQRSNKYGWTSVSEVGWKSFWNIPKSGMAESWLNLFPFSCGITTLISIVAVQGCSPSCKGWGTCVDLALFQIILVGALRMCLNVECLHSINENQSCIHSTYSSNKAAWFFWFLWVLLLKSTNSWWELGLQHDLLFRLISHVPKSLWFSYHGLF